MLRRPAVLSTLVVVLAMVVLTQCQYYDADYRVTDDVEDEDHASYEDEPKRTDYTKYYASDRSSPIVGGGGPEPATQDDAHGFVTPLDFSGLFTDGNFGFGGVAGASSVKDIFSSPIHQPFNQIQGSATTNQNQSGFVSATDFRPFFDIAGSASETGFRAKDFVGAPNTGDGAPNYFSTFGQADRPRTGGAQSYVAHTAAPPSTDKYRVAPTQSHYRKSHGNAKLKDSYDPEHYKSDEEYPTAPTLQTYESKPEYQTPDYAEYDAPSSAPYSTTSFSNDFPPTELVTTVEPHSGKSSYHVAPTLNTLSAKTQYYPAQTLPADGKHQAHYSTLSPYQKYSFQPSNYFDSIATTALPSSSRPFSKFPATTVPSFLSGANRDETELVTRKKCRRVEKQLPQHGRYRRQAMTCFICKDAKSGGTYEQCSYTSEPQEQAYFVGKKYSSATSEPAGVNSYRYKRYAKARAVKRPRNGGGSTSNDDPYDFSEHKATRYRSRPDEFTSATYSAPDFKEFHHRKSDDTYDDPNYYSFDPIIESYSAQQSEQLKDGNCKKVEKETMTCMVCANPKTGGTFEQCSYTSAPNEKKYAYTNERKFDSNDDDDEGEAAGVDEGEGTEQRPAAVVANRRSDPKPAPTKGTNGEVCEEIKKDSMVCTLCKNPKTGGKSEKCSYRSAPNPKQYAYTNERKYQNHEPPRDRHQEDGSEQRAVLRGRGAKYGRGRTTDAVDQEPPRQRQDRHDTIRDDDAHYEVPKHFVRTTKERERKGVKNGGVGLDPELYGRPVTFHQTDDKKEAGTEDKKVYSEHDTGPYEDYFAKIFPEYSAIKEEEVGNRGAASEHTEESHGFQNPEEFFADSSRRDVEEVLAEFAKKDRSKCKKITKDKLTCYMCVDEKGMKNEECMYVTESEPKSSHMAYHQVQKFRSVPDAAPQTTAETRLTTDVSATPAAEASVIVTTTTTAPAAPDGKRKRAFKKKVIEYKDEDANEHYVRRGRVAPTVPVVQVKITKTTRVPRRTTNLTPGSGGGDAADAASGTHYVYERPPADAAVASALRAETTRRERTTEAPPPEPPKPVEFEVEGTDGAFASELTPIYSKRLGLTLPAFMLTKSEHEAAFDEAVASGNPQESSGDVGA